MLLELKKTIIYGPVQSRRLGLSLGINLMPGSSKICPFNCVYCQYGWTQIHTQAPGRAIRMVTVKEVEEALHAALLDLPAKPSYITFSGNGEPTIHSRFAEIVEGVMAIRKRYAPKTQLAVLSNSALVAEERVRKPLARLDLRIMKLDCGSPGVFQRFNQPCHGIHLDEITAGLAELSAAADVIIQTLMASGRNGNDSSANVQDWIARLKKIKPRAVQLYSLARGYPAQDLCLLKSEQLNAIKTRAVGEGIPVTVY